MGAKIATYQLPKFEILLVLKQRAIDKGFKNFEKCAMLHIFLLIVLLLGVVNLSNCA